MNASPNRWRAIAAYTILASALSATLSGCSSKISTVPAAQTPPGAAGASSPANPANAAAGPPAATTAPAPAPAPEPALTLPRGTRLEVRLNQTIDVKHAESGDRFTGTLAEPVVEGNTVAVPAGSNASGDVLVAHKRGKFKGQSVLALTLTRLEVNGTQYRIDTGSLARIQKGQGQAHRSLYRRRGRNGHVNWRPGNRRGWPACRRPGWRRSGSPGRSLYRQPRPIDSSGVGGDLPPAGCTHARARDTGKPGASSFHSLTSDSVDAMVDPWSFSTPS